MPFKTEILGNLAPNYLKTYSKLSFMKEKILKKILEELKKIAKKRSKITYDILASRTGLDTYSNWFRIISEYLDEMNRRETQENRPMISAIVVRKDEGIPGDGFWDCAYYTCKVWDGTRSKEAF